MIPCRFDRLRRGTPGHHTRAKWAQTSSRQDRDVDPFTALIEAIQYVDKGLVA